MASTATQLTAPPQARRSDAASGRRVTASEWFASGARRSYDPIVKTMLETPGGEGPVQPLHEFEKVVATPRARIRARRSTRCSLSTVGVRGLPFAPVGHNADAGDAGRPGGYVVRPAPRGRVRSDAPEREALLPVIRGERRRARRPERRD